ncbi:MAG: PilW family protein [Thiotrichaceae bacterium]|nr:PilW family protein [Thiotrichaceae bacterium]
MNKQKGFSLLELLIAMSIGFVITAGVYQLFLSTNSSLSLINAQSRMQEDARFAFSFIATKLQSAGYLGCQKTSKETITSFVNTTSNEFRPWRSIEGWEASGTNYNDTFTAVLNDSVVTAHNDSHWSTSTSDVATLNAGVSAKKRSDIFKIWYTSSSTTSLSTINSNNDEITFPAFDLKRGDIVAINDCTTIKIAQVCSITESADSADSANFTDCSTTSTTPGNSSSNLGDINLTTAGMRVLREAIFFVGKRNGNNNNPPALFWKTLSNNAQLGNQQEILAGVESLQMLYGEDTDGDKTPNSYVSANSITDWESVTSIRISLLLISKKQSQSETLPIFFNNKLIASSDHHLRKVFTTTIALRNRVTGY